MKTISDMLPKVRVRRMARCWKLIVDGKALGTFDNAKAAYQAANREYWNTYARNAGLGHEEHA